MQTMNRWLIALVLVVALKQAVLILVIPAWQVPDEPAHVGYVQALVEDHTFPILSDQAMDVSSELRRSLTAIEDANPSRHGRHYPPGFLVSGKTGDRRAHNEAGLIRNLAARNSPAYYLYEGLAYSAVYQGSLETRLLAMRAASSLLLLVTIWLAVAATFAVSKNRWLALAVGAVVGFHPAAGILFAGVNPDAGSTVLATLIFWLFAVPLTKPLERRWYMMTILVGFAAALKPSGWFLALPALIWLLINTRRATIIYRLKLIIIGGGIMAVIGGSWLAIQSWRSVTPVASIVSQPAMGLSWQRILNNDLFERPFMTFRTFWGHLGWSGVSGYSSSWVFVGAFFLGLLAAAGSIIWFVRQARNKQSIDVVLILTAAILSLEALYQWLYWQAGLNTGYSHFPVHGRYYLPLIWPFALWVVMSVSQLVSRKKQWLATLVVSAFTIASTLAIIVRAWALYCLERLAGW